MKRLTLLLMMSAVAFVIASCQHDKAFSGYIPVGEKPEVVWVEDGYGYSPSGRILVVSPPDTIIATFNLQGSWLGSWLVEFRDSYPNAQDKVVYVEIENMDGGMCITKASLSPFK